MSDQPEQRQGKTALWTKRLETTGPNGEPVVIATPDWSSNSWPFAKDYWEALPLVKEEV